MYNRKSTKNNASLSVKLFGVFRIYHAHVHVTYRMILTMPSVIDGLTLLKKENEAESFYIDIGHSMTRE